MSATIDKAGRLVIPKALRALIGLPDGGEVEVREEDGRLVISPAPVAKRMEVRDGMLVCVVDSEVPPLTADTVRQVLESTRR
jgi:AbrB family looped-hinge helix DNA binding protein